MSVDIAVTYSSFLRLKLFFSLKAILFNLRLSFFFRLFQTPVFACRGETQALIFPLKHLKFSDNEWAVFNNETKNTIVNKDIKYLHKVTVRYWNTEHCQ